MFIRKLETLATSLALAVSITACGDGVSPSGTAHVTVLLTDAPIDYIGAAMVDIGAVVLVPADDGEHVVLSEDGTDGPVNLLTLRDAVTEVLADIEIEAGTYSQLRLIVEAASVTLADGYEFNTGGNEMDLVVPSGAQTGIKLNLGAAEGDGDGGVVVVGDLVFVVDFDVSRSFVLLGNPETPAGINGVHFKPTLRVVVEDEAGSISGTVSTELADTDVDGLTVTARQDGDVSLEEFQTQTVTALTDALGEYTAQFVVPGAYWVKIGVGDGLATDPDSTLVEVGPSEDVLDIDFEIIAAPAP
jgi:hypothetical protein